jgi:hypothetical protein
MKSTADDGRLRRLILCALLAVATMFAVGLGCGSSSQKQCNGQALLNTLVSDLNLAAFGGGCSNQNQCVTLENQIVTDYTNYYSCVNCPQNPPNEPEVALILFNLEDGSETVSQEIDCHQ